MIPADVLQIAGAVPLAQWAAIASALQWPHSDLPLCLGCGFDIVGHRLGYGGVFPAADPAPVEDIHDLDWRQHNADVRSQLQARFRGGDAAARQERAELLSISQQAATRGVIVQASERDLNAMFPDGWRCMTRFAVLQDGAIRACDNAKSSRHNACTSVAEKLMCEPADFPSIVAGLFDVGILNVFEEFFRGVVTLALQPGRAAKL